MSELQDPAYLGNGCITAQGDRQVLASMVCSEGVAPGVGDALVVSADAPASMDVIVGSGNAFIEGTDIAWQGMYHVSNDADVTLTVGTADPTDDRIDQVIAVVHDSETSGSADDWELMVWPGNPGPAPTPEPLPDNALLLATIAVGAGVTSITGGDITDERADYTLCSGLSSYVTNPIDSTSISGATTLTQTDSGVHTGVWSLASDQWTYSGAAAVLAQLSFSALWDFTGFTGTIETWLEINGAEVLSDTKQFDTVTGTGAGSGASAALVLQPGDVLRVRGSKAAAAGSAGVSGGVFSAVALSPA